jgi:hypothetical protein
LPELGAALRLLLWILLGLGVAMLVFALVRHFLDHKSKDDVVKTQAPDARPRTIARRRLPARSKPTCSACSNARVPRPRPAIFAPPSAVPTPRSCADLEGAGVVQVEPDQTNGDYVRRVKSERPAMAGQMAEVVDAVERRAVWRRRPSRARASTACGRA